MTEIDDTITGEDTTTRFTYFRWKGHAGNGGSWVDHPGLIFSRLQEWNAEELIHIIDEQEILQEFLGYPDHPYILLACPPPPKEAPETHNLVRRPAGRQTYYRSYYALQKNYSRRYIPAEYVQTVEHLGPDALRGLRSGRFTGDHLVAPVEEWRYLAVPSLDTVFTRELHPSTLHHEFIVVWDGGHAAFKYQQLWDQCPIIHTLSEGVYHACATCDLRGIKCLDRWFEEVLNASDVPLELADFQRTYRRFAPDSYILRHTPYDWASAYRNMFKDFDAGDTQQYDLQFVSRAKAAPVQASPFLSSEEYTPALTRLDPHTYAFHDNRLKQGAQAAAQTRREHKELCGEGDNACIFRREGCTRWRHGGCSTRWRNEEQMIEEGFKAFRWEVKYDPMDFKLALHFAGTAFECENPQTGRTVNAVYAGIDLREGNLREGNIVHTIQRTSRERETIIKGTWQEIRQAIRRHAPSEQLAFKKAGENAHHLKLSKKLILFYAECAGRDWLPRLSSGWGSGSAYARYVKAWRHWKSNEVAGMTITCEYGRSYSFKDLEEFAVLLAQNSQWFRWIPS